MTAIIYSFGKNGDSTGRLTFVYDDKSELVKYCDRLIERDHIWEVNAMTVDGRNLLVSLIKRVVVKKLHDEK